MPLPSALLARLKKRGILKQDDAGPEEEVIAEDYDDHSNKSFNHNSEDPNDIDIPEKERQEALFESMLRENVQGDRDSALACPNKYNIYHICSRFCHEHWTLNHPSPNVERKRIRMMKKYPLIEGWKEVYDAGVGRHYYWHVGTEEVSWLPPGHPRAKVSMPATKLRSLLKESEAKKIKITSRIGLDEGSDGEDDDDEDMDDDEDEEEDRRERERQRKQLERLRKSHIGRSRHEPELDPMDPAAYSECGRGTWSTGLEKKGEAKTGADVTASGPLYQMRPYPSPGAVLRMNAGMKGPPTT